MKIPETIPFDEQRLSELWRLVNLYKDSRIDEIRARIVGSLGEYRMAAGFETREYPGVKEMFSDLNLLMRIAKIKKKGFYGDCQIMYEMECGEILGMTEQGMLMVSIESRPARRMLADSLVLATKTSASKR